MTITLVVDKEFGVQEFHLAPGTHTILIDTSVIKKTAIADFLKAQTGKKHSGQAIGEDIALAIGKFDVPLSMFYDEEDISSIAQLDDFMLAEIVRHRMARENPEDDGTA